MNTYLRNTLIGLGAVAAMGAAYFALGGKVQAKVAEQRIEACNTTMNVTFDGGLYDQTAMIEPVNDESGILFRGYAHKVDGKWVPDVGRTGKETLQLYQAKAEKKGKLGVLGDLVRGGLQMDNPKECLDEILAQLPEEE